MKSSDTVNFSKRDKKCFENFAIVADAITTMGNRISRALSVYVDDLDPYLSKVIHGKKNWRMKRLYDNSFYPFTNEDYSNATKIVTLENHFEWVTELQCYKMVNKKWYNYFCVAIGYYFDAGAEKKENKVYFRFMKEVESGRMAGQLHEMEYYERLKDRFPRERVQVLDPHSEDDPCEGIQIDCSALDLMEFDRRYRLFRHRLLPELVKGIRW